jgi:hypothetical protein
MALFRDKRKTVYFPFCITSNTRVKKHSRMSLQGTVVMVGLDLLLESEALVRSSVIHHVWYSRHIISKPWFSLMGTEAIIGPASEG